MTLLSAVGCDSPIRNQVREGSAKKDNNFTQRQSRVFFNYHDKDLELFLNWYEGPYSSSTKPSGALISILDENKEAFSFPENLEIVFDALMPVMGHGLDNSGYFEEISLGLYKNAGIRFQMPGNWVMRILLIDYDDFEAEPLEVVSWESFL